MDKFGPQSDSRRSSISSNIGVAQPSDPVTLHIGRPDIGKYLAETFAKTTCGNGDSSNETVASMFASQSAKTTGGVSRPKGKLREV